ncbi:MAG: hypothetical protein KZQ87_18835 [Candidatus Thiodiazotropha sp. (ex Cardiolucina cf. quadrata)]|nr:hypothetical protein [Candidatus Thiodiazotropha sp. (ex Cardiolucina cf. quadrata)]
MNNADNTPSAAHPRPRNARIAWEALHNSRSPPRPPPAFVRSGVGGASRDYTKYETALAACMAYVDLNPVRAGVAETPEQFEYTSIAERTNKLKRGGNRAKQANNQAGLFPFIGYPRKSMPNGLPFRLKDYLELVDWTGRAILEHKRGYIPGDQPPILDRLQIDPQHWLYMTQYFESRLKGMGFTPILRTHLKRPIMAVEVCHAETKKILRGV